jgi:hypothetical protein
MLHRGLAPGDDVAAGDGLEHGAIGRRPPARSRLEHRERHRIGFELGRERRGREAHGGAAEVRDGSQARAQRARDQAQLDRAQPVVAADRQRAELDEARPQPAVLGLAREQRLHRFAEPPLLVAELEVHSGYSCGRARTRSAMMLRWICRVPPYTLAARE